MTYKLAPLPYAYDALETIIDEETVKIHHDKHHQAYVDNLNKAIEGTGCDENSIEEVLKDLDQVPEEIRTAVRNHGGGYYNHNLYWDSMIPGGSNVPVGNLKKAMDETFESFEAFKEEFDKKGAGQFGSGWVNLAEKDGKVEIIPMPNQDTPLSNGYNIILINDVWEHAYYLKYQNRRPEYLKKWWDLVNWDVAEERFNKGR